MISIRHHEFAMSLLESASLLLTISLYLSVSLSFSCSLCVCLFLYFSPSLPLSLPLSLSLSLSLPLSLTPGYHQPAAHHLRGGGLLGQPLPQQQQDSAGQAVGGPGRHPALEELRAGRDGERWAQPNPIPNPAQGGASGRRKSAWW